MPRQSIINAAQTFFKVYRLAFVINRMSSPWPYKWMKYPGSCAAHAPFTLFCSAWMDSFAAGVLADSVGGHSDDWVHDTGLSLQRSLLGNHGDCFLWNGCINSLPALTWNGQRDELPFHFTAFSMRHLHQTRSYHWWHQGHVFGIDRGFIFRTATYTNKCMIKGCPACKRLNHPVLFFFTLSSCNTAWNPLVCVCKLFLHVLCKPVSGFWWFVMSSCLKQ